MVTTYQPMGGRQQAQILPLMEEILADELIPQYQRAVVMAFPDIAQSAANDVAQQNGNPDYGRGTMQAALWRTSGEPVGGDTSDASTRTLPVVDPELDDLPDQAAYVTLAQQQRQQLANAYLTAWNNQTLLGFDQQAKMCQFSNLWRSFTCGYLLHLLTVEYPKSNLPQVIRQVPGQGADNNSYLDQYYSFIGVAYWKQVPQMMPRIFDNPTSGSAPDLCRGPVVHSAAAADLAVRFFVAKRAATDAAGRSAGGHGQPAGGRLARAPGRRWRSRLDRRP